MPVSSNVSNISDPKYGYDFVVATTQASINATMVNFLSTRKEPTIVVCYVADSQGKRVEIDYDLLKKNAKGTDPVCGSESYLQLRYSQSRHRSVSLRCVEPVPVTQHRHPWLQHVRRSVQFVLFPIHSRSTQSSFLAEHLLACQRTMDLRLQGQHASVHCRSERIQ